VLWAGILDKRNLGYDALSVKRNIEKFERQTNHNLLSKTI
jgi:hypothetical protein